MPELRLALIAIGVVLVVAVYAYSRWQGRASTNEQPVVRRRPRVDTEDLPSINASRSGRVEREEGVPSVTTEKPGRRPADELSAQAGEAAGASDIRPDAPEGSLPEQEEPEAPAPTTAPDPAVATLGGFDPESQKIISLHVLAEGEAGLPGSALRALLEENHCRHGHYGIFHRCEDDDSGQPSLLLSVANMVEPGQFDLSTMDDSTYRGVTLFAVLPGPWPGISLFREMLRLAGELAEGLGGEIRDEARNPFSQQRATHIEEQITEFERLRRQRRADRKRS